jgi:hypothetical protein
MTAYPALARLPKLLAAQRRRRAAVAGLRAFWISLAAHLIILALLAWISLRNPLAAGWLAALAWTFLIYLGVPAAYAWAFASPRNRREALARDLDHANPAAPDPFRTGLSLRNHDEETLRQLDGLLAPHLPRLAYPHPHAFPAPARLGLALGILTFAGFALASRHPAEFLARAALPWRALDRLPTLRFMLDPASGVLAAGDTARITGRVANLSAGQTLFAYVGTGAGETRYPLGPVADGRFAFTHGPVDSDFTLAFAGDNGRSAALAFRVVEPPFLARVQAILHPPAYTRLPDDTLPAGVARFPALPGTRVEWRAEADRPLRRAVFVSRSADDDGGGVGDADKPRAANRTADRTADSTADTLGAGRGFRIVREVRRATEYVFHLEDEEGIRSRASAPYRVDMAPDFPPEVDLVSPASDTVLDRDGKLALAFRAKDDFGIVSFQLVWKVVGNGRPRAEGKRDARDWLKGASAGAAQAIWDVSALHLKPEESLEFHLAATDNDTVNGPKTSRSATRIARMPTLQEVAAAARQHERSAESGLKSALQREKQLERKLEREKEPPREEGPPMLAEYEVNRIMVEDPRDQTQRTQSALGQLQQSLGAQSRSAGGEESKEAGRDMAQVQTAARELQEALKQSEPSLPRGNQGMLPAAERLKNLERLTQAQKEQSDKLAALRAKFEKAPPGKQDMAQIRREMAKQQLSELAKDLERNLQNQADLAKLFREQEAQAKAKSDLMDQAIQEQMKMAEDMKSAGEDLQKASESQAKNGLLSPELIEKMKQVQDLLREVLPDSLRNLMENKLRGQEVDEKELKQRLREMLEKQSELAENLSRALAMLEQLKDRKRMEELRQALGDLQTREQGLEKQLRAGQAGGPQDAEQKAIAQEAQKALSDFAAQAAGRKGLQEMAKTLKPASAQQDMQEVRRSLAEAKSQTGGAKSAATAQAAQAAGSAAAKLGEMGQSLGKAMAAMGGNSLDLGEASEILQESLSLSRLQLLIRSGSARRQAEGWSADEATLYASVAQTAAWIQDRVKGLSAQVPFFGDLLNAEARALSQNAREASNFYSWESAEKAIRANQNLSRELLKLMKMAQSGGGGGQGSSGQGQGEGEGEGEGQGQGGGKSGGDLASALKGMSGKQMAINQATYQLLKAMMEGRAPGPGGRQPGGQQQGSGPGQGQGQGEGQGQGGEGQGRGQGRGQGDGQGESQGQGQGQGQGGEGGAEGGLGGIANKQGELGESLESLAESEGEEGGAARKLRTLADEARRLEEELRQGRITAEELKRRQDRFQSRLLEAANAMQERGQSQERQAQASRGNAGPAPQAESPAEEARLLRMLREARRESKSLKLSEGQRKRLDEFYETLLTR